MKFTLCLLVVLPLALSVPVNYDEKRFLPGLLKLPTPTPALCRFNMINPLDPNCVFVCLTTAPALFPGATLFGGSLCGETCCISMPVGIPNLSPPESHWFFSSTKYPYVYHHSLRYVPC
ncbi:uncharacterized protein LOC132730170 [Ruditapes philippinarum]|uniref:uncharacterized protein LOC132730170 n=1 Tax=Ruditapes philippinarum TaxID=129788 RepID=UPI00295B5184|nr:uncharacterized protein LOC132730170 [Ruditapes philippinarum]